MSLEPWGSSIKSPPAVVLSVFPVKRMLPILTVLKALGVVDRVTVPEETLKSVESNCATPFALVVASVPEIVILLFDTAVAIPVPPSKVRI